MKIDKKIEESVWNTCTMFCDRLVLRLVGEKYIKQITKDIKSLLLKQILKEMPEKYDFKKKKGYLVFTHSDGTADTVLQYAWNQALTQCKDAVIRILSK